MVGGGLGVGGSVGAGVGLTTATEQPRRVLEQRLRNGGGGASGRLAHGFSPWR